MPEGVGSHSRLNREARNEIANIRAYWQPASIVWFKQSKLIALGNKNARIEYLDVFIYGCSLSDQFFKGTSTSSSGDSTMNTSNFAGSVALAFFETRCSEPAASYQYSPAL